MATDNEKSAIEVEDLLLKLSSEAVFKNLVSVAKQNGMLRQTNQGLLNSLGHVQNDFKQAKDEAEEKNRGLKRAIKTNEEQAAQVAALSERLKVSEKKVKDLEISSNEEQDLLKKNLEEREIELQRLEEFVVELEPVDENIKSMAAALDTIHTAAHKLAHKYFGGDLPPAILSNKNFWEKLNGKSANRGTIPLLFSDSLVAKQLRIALVLSVLGDELCEHIFQPSPPLKDVVGLNQLLKDLATEDPDLESHLRSVLLRVSETLRTANEPGEEPCIKAVVSNVFACVSPAIPIEKQQSFKTDLEIVCRMAYEQWSVVRTLEDLVVPELRTKWQPERTQKWKVLVFNTPPPPAASAPAPKQRPNGTSTAPGPPKNPSGAAGPQALTAGAAFDLTKAIAIWPAFCIVSSGTFDTLAEGYILPPSLIDKAVEEVEQRAPSPTSPSKSPTFSRSRREQERNSNTRPRRLSAAVRSGASGNADEAKPRGSFLLNGSGVGGSKGT